MILLFSGSEDMSHLFYPIFEVRTEVADLKVQDIPEVGVPSFSVLLASSLSAVMDYLDVGDEGLPITPLGPTNTVILWDSPSSHGSDLLEAVADSGVRSEILPSSGVLPVASPSVVVPRAAIVSGLGAFGTISAGEPSVLASDVASRSEMPLILLAKGKGHVVYPSAKDGFKESDSKPPVVPAWHSRPYAQPFLIEELMTDFFVSSTACEG